MRIQLSGIKVEKLLRALAQALRSHRFDLPKSLFATPQSEGQAMMVIVRERK
jgi:hypothetical protein